jgi:hypothetical protein
MFLAEQSTGELPRRSKEQEGDAKFNPMLSRISCRTVAIDVPALQMGFETQMPRPLHSQLLRLSCGENFLMTPDKHRAAAALLRSEAAELGCAKAATLATLHDVFAEAMQLWIDEQCPPTAPP